MRVGCTLTYDVDGPAEVAFQVAAAGPVTSELLTVTLDGAGVPVTGLDRAHLVHAGSGRLVVAYTAELPDRRDAAPPPSELDRLVALRPSRYCPSDRLAGYATDRFGALSGADAVRAIEAYVHGHLTYTPGSSGPTTDAAQTLLAGRGVCRDYAHLLAALCRAVGVPARVAAVYAPGLGPMDFHLVVETAHDGGWWVWDATRLAPRGALARIATGRDAADVAFATVLSGRLEPRDQRITATTAGPLPADDHTSLVALAG
ncbi:transglutaminase-like domain-containing protein [Phytohabitans kaempferiae]|uniref:Transglutaminase family protein n=1 Tax=Phytohabitans kaempferiae TaxID=1620943 RepID=A0ABV6MH01_9ACTN